MTTEEKIDALKTLAQEIETNRIRLSNAEQNVQQYLEAAEVLNNRLLELTTVETTD